MTHSINPSAIYARDCLYSYIIALSSYYLVCKVAHNKLDCKSNQYTRYMHIHIQYYIYMYIVHAAKNTRTVTLLSQRRRFEGISDMAGYHACYAIVYCTPIGPYIYTRTPSLLPAPPSIKHTCA